MLKPFICGTGSFDHPLEEHDQGTPCSSPPTSKKSRKIGSCKTKDDKNPYSNRGLDKFSALLKELEDKKQRIYSEISPDEISFLRFTYSNSNDCRPILIRVKQRNQDSNSDNVASPVPVVDDLKERNLAPSSPAVTDRKEVLAKEEVKARLFSADKETMEKEKEKKKKQSGSTTMKKVAGMQRPLNYLTAALILTLVLLVLFGKSFAILCLSMGWYLVPSIKGAERFELGNSKEATRNKKDYTRTRRHSENLKMKKIDDGLSSPNSVLGGPTAGYATPRRQGPLKCW